MTAVIFLNIAMVALVVVIHYESLFQLSRLLPRLNVAHRYHIAIGVVGALVAHVVEIILFAVAYYFMHASLTWGQLEGVYNGSFADSIYFSFTTYSTLGFGDIEPVGNIRYLVGIESLTGLVLITWSASFLYLEMQKYWQDGERGE